MMEAVIVSFLDQRIFTGQRPQEEEQTWNVEFEAVGSVLLH
jgi:hypothetical protein